MNLCCFKPQSVCWFNIADIYFQSIDIFSFCLLFPCSAKAFTQVPFIYFYFHYCGRQIEQDISVIYVRDCSAYVFLYEFYSIQSHILEKAMAPHSSTLAWKIPWMEEPGRLQSMGSLKVGVTSLSFFTFMHWRRKWQPTPVFLPGESQRRGSLVGCRLWGRTESDRTEAT